MNDVARQSLPVVLLCHFTAALVALGMPPYFGMILADAFAVEAQHWVGWFYVLPTICTALVAPLWGRAADRWGRRWSLLRAQLGLALAFLLAGLAPNLWTFLAALILQGLLGGTFAASSAYLATGYRGADLSRGLNWMQGSARAAMVLAPVLFGLLISRLAPQQIYLYLACLPLLAALLLGVATPADKPLGDVNLAHRSTRRARKPSPEWRRLWSLQFAFNFAMVATFPYFIPWAQQSIAVDTVTAGALFSLPHLVYLLVLWTTLADFVRATGPAGLALGLLILALSYVGQAGADSLPWMTAWRLAMGLGMTLGFFALNDRIARLTQVERAGRTFGSLDSVGKWAGVAAGFAAGVLVPQAGLEAPLWMGAGMLMVTLPLIYPLPSAARGPVQSSSSVPDQDGTLRPGSGRE